MFLFSRPVVLVTVKNTRQQINGSYGDGVLPNAARAQGKVPNRLLRIAPFQVSHESFPPEVR